MGMREPEAPSSAATDPPYRTSGHEPPKQQRPDAQPDEVQEEELHVERHCGAAMTSATAPATMTRFRFHHGCCPEALTGASVTCA